MRQHPRNSNFMLFTRLTSISFPARWSHHHHHPPASTPTVPFAYLSYLTMPKPKQFLKENKKKSKHALSVG
jgi:hypothetical protein